MKGKIIVAGIILVFITISTNLVFAKSNVGQREIAEKLIRFHVIANSDTIEDQELKLKVRDKVLEFISPKLKETSKIEVSRQILKENNAQIVKIAEDCIKSNGYEYSVKIQLSQENFPIKSYGNITLPQGEYEAYRIIIGNGKGQNWWCVMFPPLCFIDITKGQISNKQTEKQMKAVLTQKEYDEIDNTRNKNKIKIEFKLVNILKALF